MVVMMNDNNDNNKKKRSFLCAFNEIEIYREAGSLLLLLIISFDLN